MLVDILLLLHHILSLVADVSLLKMRPSIAEIGGNVIPIIRRDMRSLVLVRRSPRAKKRCNEKVYKRCNEEYGYSCLYCLNELNFPFPSDSTL